MASNLLITIAMTDGSRGEEVAREAASRLGFRYINDEVLDIAAQKAGVDAKTVAAVEHSESLVARVMRGLAMSPPGDLTASYVPAGVVFDERPEYRALIHGVLRSVAAEGKVVIGAHAASLLLAGTAGLLRVFVTAPVETRVARVAVERSLGAGDARKAVEHSDRERKAYFERFFRVSAELPTHYDLVINTEVLGLEDAARLIEAAAG